MPSTKKHRVSLLAPTATTPFDPPSSAFGHVVALRGCSSTRDRYNVVSSSSSQTCVSKQRGGATHCAKGCATLSSTRKPTHTSTRKACSPIWICSSKDKQPKECEREETFVLPSFLRPSSSDLPITSHSFRTSPIQHLQSDPSLEFNRDDSKMPGFDPKSVSDTSRLVVQTWILPAAPEQWHMAYVGLSTRSCCKNWTTLPSHVSNGIVSCQDIQSGQQLYDTFYDSGHHICPFANHAVGSRGRRGAFKGSIQAPLRWCACKLLQTTGQHPSTSHVCMKSG